ncbi:MAG: PP2C family protein-serine/threonine phosphatase, partial [Desulfohalobium sp.]
AVMALVNRRKHTLELLSAGHTPALYLPQNGPPQVLETQGDVLGIFDHIHVDTLRMPLAAGDRIVLYSDGLVEYGSQDGDRDAGLQTLLAACETMRQHTIQGAVHEMVETVLEDGGAPVQDDIVALGVEV